jgi:hypothetical protein
MLLGKKEMEQKRFDTTDSVPVEKLKAEEVDDVKEFL